MPDRKTSILKNSWSECEQAIESIGMKNSEKAQAKIGKREWLAIIEFLRSIGFVDNDTTLTDIGRDYFKSKFILKDKNLSTEILSGALKRFLPTQAICQLLWGRPNLFRESVYKLLVFEEFVNSKELREQDMGGFLMLLNQCYILKYNKKSNGITIVYNPRGTEEAETSTKFLSPETPYSNVRNLKEIFRNSEVFIHWFDKHFSAKGLEPLADEADGTKINEIRILTGITSGGINGNLRSDFTRFRDEMKTRQISAECRVLCDKSVLNSIHDRWVSSKNAVFNIPPVNTIFQGQYSEMKKTENRPPFSEWWSKGLDIVEQWQEIAKHIEKQQA